MKAERRAFAHPTDDAARLEKAASVLQPTRNEAAVLWCTDELPELQRERARRSEVLLGMRRAAAACVPIVRARQSGFRKILLRMRRAAAVWAARTLEGVPEWTS